MPSSISCRPLSDILGLEDPGWLGPVGAVRHQAGLAGSLPISLGLENPVCTTTGETHVVNIHYMAFSCNTVFIFVYPKCCNAMTPKLEFYEVMAGGGRNV